MTVPPLLIKAVVLLLHVDLSAGVELTVRRATCVLGQVTPTDSRPLDGLRVECPQGTHLQQVGSSEPEDSKNAKVLTRAGGGSVFLRTLLPSATYVQVVEGNASVNTLTVSQLPEKSVGLYFECRHNNRVRSCYVHVNILPAHRLGPNVCEVLGSRINFSVHAENETVMFKCGTGLMLLPTDARTVYDGNCNNTINLDTVLPDSYVSHASHNQPNILVANYLPPSPQSLCFICAPLLKTPTESNSCLVRVTTAAGSGTVSRRKRTVSGAVGSGDRTAFILKLLLFGVGYLNFR